MDIKEINEKIKEVTTRNDTHFKRFERVMRELLDSEVSLTRLHQNVVLAMTDVDESEEFAELHNKTITRYKSLREEAFEVFSDLNDDFKDLIRLELEKLEG